MEGIEAIESLEGSDEVAFDGSISELLSSNAMPIDELPDVQQNLILRTSQVSERAFEILDSVPNLSPLEFSVTPTTKDSDKIDQLNLFSHNITSEEQVKEVALNEAKPSNAASPSNQNLAPSPIQQYIQLIDEEKRQLLSSNNIPNVEELSHIPPEEQKGFLILYADFVSEMLKILFRMGDIHKTDHKKKQYELLNEEIGNAILDRGSSQFWSNLLGFAVRISGAAAGGLLGNDVVEKFTDFIGQQIPTAASLWTTEYEKRQAVLSNKLSMVSTDIQSSSQQKSDQSGMKNEMIQFLESIRNFYSSATRPG
jgi:hypothetical protein